MSSATGFITTIAGNGTYGFPRGGGAATNAMMGNPEGLALDSLGNLYIAEQGACIIAKLNLSTGTISTVAGNGTPCSEGNVKGDGSLTTLAPLAEPSSVALDAAGNLFIADTGNSLVRQATTTTGIITSVVGTSPGYSGDGGPSDRAQLHNPSDLFFDVSGNLYIADSDNGVIRKVTP